MSARSLKFFGTLFFTAAIAGCITIPYEFHASPPVEQAPVEDPASPIERGDPHIFLDDVASWTIGAIPKLILWNGKMEKHEISYETEELLRQYLADNDLGDVKVRINQYAPGGEWRRLFNNPSVGLGWRLTIGVLSNVFYTILPGRFFGGDSYNPYTNTISLYSDVPAVGLHEGGHAKDLAGRKWKGSYAFFTSLPLVSLYSEGVASSDALSYLEHYKKRKDQRNAYKVLYPAYATYIGGELVPFWPISTLWALVPVIPAHIVGRIRSSKVDASDDPDLIALVEGLAVPGVNQCSIALRIGGYGSSAQSKAPLIRERLADARPEARQCLLRSLEKIE